jgi:hypothetical protein
MRCRRLRLALLAAIAAASSSSAGALSQAPPDVTLVGAVRGSILVADNRGIYRRYAGGALKQLTSTAASQYDLYPAWSRAGTRIAFERITLPHKSCPLMVMNSDGSDLHQVAQVTTDCSGASWGPNDDQLVFVSGPQFGNGASLRIVNLDGTGLRNLLRGRGANPAGTHPTWSPDGRTIASVGAPVASAACSRYAWTAPTSAPSSSGDAAIRRCSRGQPGRATASALHSSAST